RFSMPGFYAIESVRMSRSLFLGVAAAVAGILGGWDYRSPEATFVKAGQQAPHPELPTLRSGGAQTHLSNFRGRPGLLVMFLSGCHSCEDNAQALERLHREFLQKGLVVLGVAVDPDEKTTADFVKRHQLTFLVMQDLSGAAAREVYHSWKMPEAYLIDASGRVDAVYVGNVDWRSVEVRERITPLLPKDWHPQRTQ